MKKQILLLAILICSLLLTGCAGRTNSEKQERERPTIMDNPAAPSESTSPEPDMMSSEIVLSETIPAETMSSETTAPEIDSTIEHSFLGTVIEESTSYMIVEPDATEEEWQLSDRFTVTYPSEHYDYLYGEGRRVVIYYYETPAMQADFEIITDDISTEGFREFELSVKLAEDSDDPEKIEQKKTLIREGLYYYGVSDISVSVDSQTIPLAEALEAGKITLNALIARANQDVRDGIAIGLPYNDGGSTLYQYPDYAIMRYHTVEGNRNVYIGSPDMNINVGL